MMEKKAPPEEYKEYKDYKAPQRVLRSRSTLAEIIKLGRAVLEELHVPRARLVSCI